MGILELALRTPETLPSPPDFSVAPGLIEFQYNFDPFVTMTDACHIRNGSSLWLIHYQLVEENYSPLGNPYYEFCCDKDVKPFYHYTRNDLTVKAGPIGAFTEAEMATWVQLMTQVYVDKSTMGSFPKNDFEARSRLLAIMATGFSPNHIPIMVTAN